MPFVGDHADLRQPARQRLRSLDDAAQGLGALGQGRRLGERRKGPPIGARRFVRGRQEVLAQGRGQGRLEARLNGERIDQRRPWLFVPGLQQAGQGPLLRFQPGQGGRGGLQRRNRVGGFVGGLGASAVRRLRVGARPLELGAGRGKNGLCRVQGRRVHRVAFQLRMGLGDLGGAGGEATLALAYLRNRARQACPAGLGAGHPLGELGEAGFQGVDGPGGGGQGVGRLPAGRLLAVRCLFDARALGLEALHGGAGVFGKGLLAGGIGGHLLQAKLALLAGGRDSLFLGVQAVAGQDQPLQFGRRPGLRLAQLGQVGGGIGLPGGAGAGAAGQFGDLAVRVLEPRAAGFRLVGGGAPAQVEQGRLGAADVIAEVAVAVRLPGLFLEAVELGVEGDQYVVDAAQVGFGAAQAQFGLVAARMQTGDAGGLLQDGTPFGRLGGDDGADPPLADDRRGTGAAGRVGEQNLDVAGAHLLAVDAVGGAAAPFDAAADAQFRVIVVAGGGGAVVVVQAQHDLGDVARRPLGGAVEDDVVHFAAAHLLGRGLAHDPAQRLDQVGLAAPVGSDDAGQAGFDQELRAVDEGLEAGKPQFLEAQHDPAPLALFLERFFDDVPEVLEGPRAQDLLAFDDERGRRIDTELLLGVGRPFPDVRHQGFVHQAGFEILLGDAAEPGHARQFPPRIIAARPLRLAAVQDLDEAEVLCAAGATGQHGRRQGQPAQGEIAVDQAHLARTDVGFLDLGQDVAVEGGAMGAGQGRILDHGHRRIVAAHDLFRHRVFKGGDAGGGGRGREQKRQDSYT